jgi:hypothetical protein
MPALHACLVNERAFERWLVAAGQDPWRLKVALRMAHTVWVFMELMCRSVIEVKSHVLWQQSARGLMASEQAEAAFGQVLALAAQQARQVAAGSEGRCARTSEPGLLRWLGAAAPPAAPLCWPEASREALAGAPGGACRVARASGRVGACRRHWRHQLMTRPLACCLPPPLQPPQPCVPGHGAAIPGHWPQAHGPPHAGPGLCQPAAAQRSTARHPPRLAAPVQPGLQGRARAAPGAAAPQRRQPRPADGAAVGGLARGLQLLPQRRRPGPDGGDGGRAPGGSSGAGARAALAAGRPGAWPLLKLRLLSTRAQLKSCISRHATP